MEKVEKKEVYEIGYHIVSSVAEEGVPAQVEAIKGLLGKAEIISEEAPKLIDLVYTITKQVGGMRRRYDTAYFGWVKFAVEPEAIQAIKKQLDGMENVLRFILVKTVRDNTMVGSKLVAAEETTKRKTATKKEDKKEDKEKKPVSAEEIDKSIDELIKE
jgi:ribosomal protein S6